ncbi:LLM class flavin-dependent oxidoreductase [Geomicrobium sediminis]|uniref:Alkanesulfonate monooxygenase n=1 Tax=Geomicrobium sediminis TaxID=1347788 RepID=A0ABS2PHD1_9BACL|nr:LLM class flavin-dependent oxidoreductase [Geomicrobium sediminis]MBM7634853.1 alkanesulfonate monooxygenase [Geomicrobium sediminis]
MVEFITMAPTSGDGRVIATGNAGWTNGKGKTEREPTFEYIRDIALAAERGGFSSLLLPTGAGCLDSLAVAASLSTQTESLKFLFAARPGVMSPFTFAKQFATVDNWSGGRALVNIVTGGSPTELAAYGDFQPHDVRYRRTEEYIHVLKRLFTEENVTHSGEFYELNNASLFPELAQTKAPEIYFGGASETGRNVAAKQADVYMTWGETLDNTRETITDVKSRAAKENRELSYSVSFQVILGEIEEQAFENAEQLIKDLSPEALEQKQTDRKKGDSEGVRRLHDLMENSRESNFLLAPNLWAGLTQVLSGNSIALVGTPEQVAARIVEYVELGFDKVLLRGFPHLEVIEQIGREVLPLVREQLKKPV